MDSWYFIFKKKIKKGKWNTYNNSLCYCFKFLPDGNPNQQYVNTLGLISSSKQEVSQECIITGMGSAGQWCHEGFLSSCCTILGFGLLLSSFVISWWQDDCFCWNPHVHVQGRKSGWMWRVPITSVPLSSGKKVIFHSPSKNKRLLLVSP